MTRTKFGMSDNTSNLGVLTPEGGGGGGGVAHD